MPLNYRPLIDELLRAWGRGDPRLMAAVLVFGSILLYVMASNLAHSYRSLFPPHALNRIEEIARQPGAGLALELLQLVYFIGIPYVALLIGWLDLRSLGLARADWPDGIRWTLALSVASWLLLTFIWLPYLRATPGIASASSAERRDWARRAVHVVYMQAHWAFYRAVAISVLLSATGDATAVYWGACAGIALVGFESWLDPRTRQSIMQPGDGESHLWNAGQAVINTAGFVLTRNSWLLVLVHLALEFAVPHARPATRSALAPAHRFRPTPPPVHREAPKA